MSRARPSDRVLSPSATEPQSVSVHSGDARLARSAFERLGYFDDASASPASSISVASTERAIEDTRAKADRNREMADICRAALHPTPTEEGKPNG